MTTTRETIPQLTDWFGGAGGALDTSALGFARFGPDAGGRGAVALRDVPAGHALFRVPRALALSTRTSALPARLGPAWKAHGLHKGWAGLILCMMWEAARGADSPWSGYLETMPTTFTTPIFWSEEDMAELQGTAVVDKIGRTDAEEDYHGKVVPALLERPDLFPPEQLAGAYSLAQYHMMGSRILSRSFTVQRWDGGSSSSSSSSSPGPGPVPDAAPEHNHDHGAEDEEADMEANTSGASGMDVDSDAAVDAIVAEEEAVGDSDDEDEDDPSDVAMVPMADMLNARYGCENAKLFYERTHLCMTTTRAIQAGEQIWNTYADPPNSDLLRRYGHVDVIHALHVPAYLNDSALPPPPNPADIFELRADTVVAALGAGAGTTSAEDVEARVEWWLEEGGDDVFILAHPAELPAELLSFVRLLQLAPAEFASAQEKGKIPKPKPVTPALLRVVRAALAARAGAYATSYEADEARCAPESIDALSAPRRAALVVRIGERRVLRAAAALVEAELAAAERVARTTRPDAGKGKRKAEEGEGRVKRVRR